jgi:hypothetical protein
MTLPLHSIFEYKAPCNDPNKYPAPIVKSPDTGKQKIIAHTKTNKKTITANE